MELILPVYVEERPKGENKSPLFIVRPLLRANPERRSEKLSRALSQLSNDLHSEFKDLSGNPRHDAFAELGQSHAYEETTVSIRLELKSGSHLCRLFLVGYPALDRKLFCSPSMPELTFEVRTGQDLTKRATETFTHHFREIERKGGELVLDQFGLASGARAHLLTIELRVQPSHAGVSPKHSRGADIFGRREQKLDGERELRKVRRSLQSLYPDELDRAVGREAEVNELARLLGSRDRRSILLVGPRQVGKTAIIHELVWRKQASKTERIAGRRELWLISPMRLISGMSYLGQWEDRVHAILDHAERRDLVLTFDDLLGLFTAGQSAASDLSVAHLLRSRLEQRSIRVLAEITPEALRVLRERDRALADAFHILPVPEPPEPETLRILTAAAQQFEVQHRCEFMLEVVPTAYELHRRFVSDAAFPGKAAGFLRRLAMKHEGGSVDRQSALREFAERSGLQTALLDGRVGLSRGQIMESLRCAVAGQDHALGAFIDALVLLKARLNDPRRPLATLLLVGPTGVGKTQSAKALAGFLFGSEERLLRFDMNEYVDSGAVVRLTGTLREPEGLLTSAIRRQPFAVVLFDEIEKAAPEVFDLLLAVLDEGRLSDALGRVANFTNAVILLSSNLGAREVRSRLGFGSADAAGDDIYISAAEKFFRPEFYNRLDRVIPFRELSREELEKIARQLLDGVLGRAGLRRRKCLLRVAPEAMSRLVELGHHPQLGARALKRTVEREIAQPLARRLSGIAPGAATVAELSFQEGALQVRLREMQPVPRTIWWPEKLAAHSPSKLLDQVHAALEGIERELEAGAPRGPIELTSLCPEHARYFHCREQLRKVERIFSAAEHSLAPRRTSRSQPIRTPGPKAVKIVLRQTISGNVRFDRQREAESLQQDLAELNQPETIDLADSPGAALVRELSLLHALATRGDDRPCALVIETDGSLFGITAAQQMSRQLHIFFNGLHGVESVSTYNGVSAEDALLKSIVGEPFVIPETTPGLFLSGPNIRSLALAQTGDVLVRSLNHDLFLVRIRLCEAASIDELRSLVKAEPKGAGSCDDEAILLSRTLDWKHGLTDHHTGLVAGYDAKPEEIRAMHLSALPLPPELEL